MELQYVAELRSSLENALCVADQESVGGKILRQFLFNGYYGLEVPPASCVKGKFSRDDGPEFLHIAPKICGNIVASIEGFQHELPPFFVFPVPQEACTRQVCRLAFPFL